MSNLDKMVFDKGEVWPAREPYDGIVAFQMVKYTLDFYGTEISNTLDTKIMDDGRQIVIDGDGFIAAGTELPR